MTAALHPIPYIDVKGSYTSILTDSVHQDRGFYWWPFLVNARSNRPLHISAPSLDEAVWEALTAISTGTVIWRRS